MSQLNDISGANIEIGGLCAQAVYERINKFYPSCKTDSGRLILR